MLLEKYSLGDFELNNRMVMAPLTRCRAIDNIPNDLMAEYYSQRSGAGLIITEGTAPSPNGLGYARIPGIYSPAQIEGWKKVTGAVHSSGGVIFLQIMHTGRVSHPDNMPEGSRVLAPSAVRLENDQMYTDKNGMQDYPTPQAMELSEVKAAQDEYVQAAKNALKAGFDGVELHAANGYLLNQFLSPVTNHRTDKYGGSVENRNRFVIETAERVVGEIGSQRVGIRISPYGVFSGMGAFDGIEGSYLELIQSLNKIGMSYVHLVDHSSMGTPEVPEKFKAELREACQSTFLLSGGYDKERAEADLSADKGDLVAFGRPFIANPDLPRRFVENMELNDPDPDTFYTPGPEGYTDYPRAD